MISSLEMVSEPSGKTKTLADLIKEGSILTPETLVHTSDDSIELKDYIESLIPEPPKPGEWTTYQGADDFAYNVATKWPAAIQTALKSTEDTYSDVLIMIENVTNTYIITIADTWENFKKIFKAASDMYISAGLSTTRAVTAIYTHALGADSDGDYTFKIHAEAAGIHTQTVKYSISVR